MSASRALGLTTILALAGCLHGTDDTTLPAPPVVATIASVPTAPTGSAPVADRSGGGAAVGIEAGAGAGAAPPSVSTSTEPVRTSAERLCGAVEAEQVGSLHGSGLVELSGLAASRTQPGVIWAVQDSGNDPQLFALGLDGADLGVVTVEGADNRDWEDIAAGPDGMLYIADIGDNAERRPEVVIQVVAEPAVEPGAPARLAASTPVVRSILVRYPDGPHDAEALVHDPLSGHLFVITKSLAGEGLVFRVVASLDGSPVQADEVGRLHLGFFQAVTGGDISADGSTIVVRTYTDVLVWDRAAGSGVAEALAAEPCVAVGPPDAQGEAITVLSDGSGYVTSSEGAQAPVWLVRRT